MRKYKILLITVIFTVVSTLNVFAFRTKVPYGNKESSVDTSSYMYYEDFSNIKIKGVPFTFSKTYFPESTSMQVIKTENEEGNLKKMLLIKDDLAAGSPYVEIPINKNSGKVYFETKFRIARPGSGLLTVGFDMYGSNESTAAARVFQGSNTSYLRAYSQSGTNLNLGPTTMPAEEWQTLQILVDIDNGIFDVQLESDALKGLTTTDAVRFDSKAGVSMAKGLAVTEGSLANGLKKIRVLVTNATGEFYIDYLTLRDDVKEIEYKGAKPKPLELPKKLTPGRFAVADMINVSYNNSYIYFVNKPFVENNLVYTPVRDTAVALGFKLSYENGTYTMTKGKNKVEISKEKILVNGSESGITAPVVKGNVYYVPVEELVKALGCETTSDGVNIVITGKVD